ncbi:MAG: septum formation inhibitor Maf [Erysipelothrix sp.]|jgi:septum formation protein|nr:septum formation inhibitor Maf [Erysipelothrix sp.]
MRIILASASPRRLEMLNQCDLSFDVIPAHIDESIHEHEPLKTYVTRMANEKNQVVFNQYPHSCVISADTIVVLNDELFGKPIDDQDAFRMLKKLSGQTHQVMTAMVIQSSSFKEEVLSVTNVKMTSLCDEDILAYINTQEPMDKAGAYAIQGKAGWMIEKIEGDFYTVVGLPLNQCMSILRKNQVVDLQKAQ